LFEDIREAVFKLADPALYDTIIITNLCVPTASGVPLDLLPDEINGVRIIGIDVPGFGVPTHAEAKDVLAAAMLEYARKEELLFVNLGMAPMTGITNPANTAEQIISIAMARIKRFQHYKGLREFKEKYAAIWENKYLIYDNDFDLIQLPRAIKNIMKP